MAMRIGRLAALTGTNSPTIRYYELIGLLPSPRRCEGGQRAYDHDDVERLTFIRRCRAFGFSVRQTQDLLLLACDRSRCCTNVRDIARKHLDEVRAKLAELRALECSISGFIDTCDTSCAGGPGPDCAIFRDLAAEPERPSAQRGGGGAD